MRNGSLLPSRRGVAVVGALVLASASMLAAGPGGVALAASKPSKSPTPSPAFGAPAASGKISYVSGGSLEVQNEETGQTTVKVTSKTVITATVAVSLKAVASGSCITATGAKAKNGSLDATTVTLVAATGGKCAAGRFGSGGFRSAGGGGNFQPRTTGGTASHRSFPAAAANAATAFGKVTSVSGSTVNVEGNMFSFSAARSGSSSKKRTTSTTVPKATKVTVDVSSKTKYLKTGVGSANSLKVGECATAFGSTSSIGAVTATRLSVTPATGGTCGFGGFGGGFGGPGGAASARG